VPLETGRNEGGQGGQIPGRRITMGTLNHRKGRRKVPKIAQILFPVQQICFRKSTGSNMGRQTCFFAPGAIKLVIPLLDTGQSKQFFFESLLDSINQNNANNKL